MQLKDREERERIALRRALWSLRQAAASSDKPPGSEEAQLFARRRALAHLRDALR